MHNVHCSSSTGAHIRELVDSLCRDGTDVPIT